jgi:cell fate regulator YaaT (PSP1 superfamily)
MVNIVGIRFPNSAKTYCFEAESVEVKAGDRVVVESELGISIGDVYRTRCEMKSSGKALKPVLRKVTEADLQQEQENEGVRRNAIEYCKERIKERDLSMKLINADVTLDRKRFIFYFVAETRIDFRDLVKDLAAKFRTRIELRQIGVRDAAKLTGGYGICGKEFCCRSFLKSFVPISIKMAKQQDLVLNTCKLSGVCGRLLCCLSYEYLTEAEMKERRAIEAQEAAEARKAREEEERRAEELRKQQEEEEEKIRAEMEARRAAAKKEAAPAREREGRQGQKKKGRGPRWKRGKQARTQAGPQAGTQAGPQGEPQKRPPAASRAAEEGKKPESPAGTGTGTRKKRRRRRRPGKPQKQDS